jgi:hypothetical protein
VFCLGVVPSSVFIKKLPKVKIEKKRFWRFSVTRSEKGKKKINEKGKNHQIHIFGFHCVIAKNIEV